MAEAEIQIDASKGLLIVRGEPSFVSEAVEKYKSVFEGRPLAEVKPAREGSGSDEAKTKKAAPSTIDGFDNVFDVSGDAVSILTSPPGGTIAAQARALIILYLYARHKMGVEPTTADAIKEQLKAHGCFDVKNFAGHLKSQKSLVAVAGGNASMTARLTVPGRRAAEELAQKLQNGE